MKLSQVITLNAASAMAFGIAFALYSPLMVVVFGVPENPGGDVLLYWNVISFARLFGAALFSFGLLLWALRTLAYESAFSQVRRGLIYSLIFSNVLSCFVVSTQQAAVWRGPAGWAFSAVFALFALAYGFFLVYTSKSVSDSPTA